MSVLTQDSVFTSLQQHGPMATTDSVQLNSPFSRQAREWLRVLRENRLNVTKYRALRSQVFEFLNISNFAQIPTLLKTPQLRKERSHRACALLGNMFGVQGTSQGGRGQAHRIRQDGRCRGQLPEEQDHGALCLAHRHHQ